ncbi:MAG: tetratricopeptide repeat protein [Pirellulales bacterium]
MHFDRARLLYLAERYRPAIDELSQELIEQPDCPWTHAALSNCLSMLGDHDGARLAAETAVENGPELDFAYAALAWAHHRAHETDAARRAIDEALRLDPDSPDHLYLFALIELPRDLAAALAATERALALDPEHLNVWSTRALALHAAGRHDAARDAATQGLSNAPNDAKLHRTLGWALLAEKQYTDAEERFAEALRLNPHSVSTRSGLIRARRGQFAWYRVGRRWRDRLANWLCPRPMKEDGPATVELLLLLGLALLTMLDAIWVPSVAIGDLLTRPWRGQSPELWKRARRASRSAACGIAVVTFAALGAWIVQNTVTSAAWKMIAVLAIMATAISAMSKPRAWWIFGAGLVVVAVVGLFIPVVYLVELAWGQRRRVRASSSPRSTSSRSACCCTRWRSGSCGMRPSIDFVARSCCVCDSKALTQPRRAPRAARRSPGRHVREPIQAAWF